MMISNWAIVINYIVISFSTLNARLEETCCQPVQYSTVQYSVVPYREPIQSSVLFKFMAPEILVAI